MFGYCPDTFARKYPRNYVILSIFTLCESFLVGFICSFYDEMIVLTALGLTALIVCSLSLYAIFTKSDFTSCGAFLCMFAFSMIGMGIVYAFYPSDSLALIKCWLGVLLAGLYIIYDTQLIMGDKSYGLQIDDYILGAFMLYVDIIYMFLKILELLGRN